MGDAFIGTAYGIGQILFLAALAGWFARRNWITQTQVSSLSKLTVFIFLPALTFYQNVTGFDHTAMPYWWMIPLGMALFVIVMVWICRQLIFRWSEKRNLLSAVAVFQNVAYLTIAVGYTLYPGNKQYFVYVFLMQMGLSPILWSLGKMLVTTDGPYRFSYKALITPPFVANVVSIAIVLLGLAPYVPDFLLGSAKMVGDATVGSAMVVLGAMLGTIPLTKFPKASEITLVMLVKFILIPAIAFCGIYFTGLYHNYPVLCEVIIIQAAAAAATNLMIQIRTYGGDVNKAGSLMLIGYIVCLFMLPLWVSLWRLAVGNSI